MFGKHSRLVTILALAGTLPLLGGCYTDQTATGSIYPTDYRDRHAIKLSNAPRVLDVFVQGRAGLDARQRQDVATYAAEHRRYGSGPIVAQVPAGVADATATQRTLAAIRAIAGPVSVSSYEPADPGLASPVRLTFRRLQAGVVGRCGLWPQDLGVDDIQASWNNDPYWNLGCANQANVAAQIADPVDLVRGRTEGTPDTVKRMNAFERLRAGQDPSTTYKQDGQNRINQSVGQ